MTRPIAKPGPRLGVTTSGLLLVGSLLLPGCDSGVATTPEPVVYTRDNPPPFVCIPVASDAPSFFTEPGWYQVASAEVKRGERKTVGGSHYELLFYPTSLTRPTITATIHEYDGHVLEFELGPHGETFATPVQLEINYSGTDADPSTSYYRPGALQIFYFNPLTDIWEPVPGIDDQKQLKYWVTLNHFSRYGFAIVEGKAGW